MPKRSWMWALAEIRRWFSISACNGPFRTVSRYVLKGFNWQPMVVSKLESVFVKTEYLCPSSESTVVTPTLKGDKPFIRTTTFPAVGAHILRSGAVTTPYSPAIVIGENLFLQSHHITGWDRVRTLGPSLFNLERKYCIGRINASIQINEGVLIGGAGANNWYHFVMEILPKVFLLRNLSDEYIDLPLLVPDECRTYPSFATALAVFAGKREIRFLRQGDIAQVNRLIVIDEVSIGPFDMKLGEWPRIDDYSQNNSVMLRFLTEFREKLLSIPSGLTGEKIEERRIFLVRPGIRRNFNQDELLEIAQHYNFESYSPEKFTLHEQARVFSESSAVIGPSGAAWVGMAFRSVPLRGLTWLPREYQQFCAYSSLANILGHQLDFIEAKPSKRLTSTSDAYNADYRVCPIQFERALKIMLGQQL